MKDDFVHSPRLRGITVGIILISIIIIASIQVHLQNFQDFKNQYSGILNTSISSASTTAALVLGPDTIQEWNNPNYPFMGLGDNGIFLSLIGGRANLSMPIRDTSGNEIGQIVNNHWTIYSPQLIQDRNFNENSLEIKDLKGNISFQVKIEGNKIYLAGCFYPKNSNGKTFSIRPWLQGSIFEYPSIENPHRLNPMAISSPPGAMLQLNPGQGGCLTTL